MNRVFPSVIVAAALLLSTAVPAAAASCNGASHQIDLSAGSASPGGGPPGTTIVFRVGYADTAGCVPSSVVVKVAGLGTFAMAAAGSDFASGVTFSVGVTPPPGAYSYAFTATSGSGAGEKSASLTSTAPASVVISAPTPAATTRPPTPAPTLPPTAPPPQPTAPQATTAAPSPGSVSASPGASRSATTTPAQSVSPSASSTTAAPSDGPQPPGAASIGGPPGLNGAGEESSTTAAPVDPTWDLPPLDLRIPAPIIAYLVSTLAGLAIFFAIVKRSRLPGDKREIVGVTPAGGQGEPPAASRDQRPWTPIPQVDEPRPPDSPDELAPGPDEAGVPRWLRPSVREAHVGRTGRVRGWD